MGRFRGSIGRLVDHLEVAPALALTAARSAVAPAALEDPQLNLTAERDSFSLSPLAGLDGLGQPARFGQNGFVPVVRDTLTEVSDDRRFPRWQWKARRISSQAASVSSTPMGRSVSSAPFSFNAARFVIPCVRRKARREAIFATGKHGGGHKRPKRGRYSFVRC